MLTWVLAIVGAALAAFPLFATVLLSIIGSAMEGEFIFDFLMPAELFPVAAIGAVLLVIAAWRVKRRQRAIVMSMLAAAGLLLAAQGLAVLTGLASGTSDPIGWRLVIVLALLAGFIVALIALVRAGWMLIRDLMRTPSLAR